MEERQESETEKVPGSLWALVYRVVSHKETLSRMMWTAEVAL